jgi:hypothetical protein
MGEEPEVSGTPDGLQFGVTRRGTIMVKDGSFSYVQPAEGDWRRALSLCSHGGGRDAASGQPAV